VVLPAVTSKEEVEAALEQFDTLVLMKAGRALSWLIPLLTEKQMLSRTIMLCNIGMEGEYIGMPFVTNTSYFTTLIIKKKIIWLEVGREFRFRMIYFVGAGAGDPEFTDHQRESD